MKKRYPWRGRRLFISFLWLVDPSCIDLNPRCGDCGAPGHPETEDLHLPHRAGTPAPRGDLWRPLTWPTRGPVDLAPHPSG